MGFSVSASFAVAAIAGLIALGMLYPALAGGFEQVSEAQQDAGERRLDAVNTAINVTAACYDAGTNEVRLSVENTGSTGLGLNRTHVLVNNDYQVSFDSRDVDGISGTSVWAPGQTLNLVLSYTLNAIIEGVPPSVQSLVVATEHGVRDRRSVDTC